MGVKNRRISFHMHSHSSAELKHNYSWVLLVGRGRRYLMTCWKTVTPGWKLHSKLSRHFQSNAAKKGAEEEEELFPCLVWWYLNQLFAQRVDGSDFSGYLRSFVAQPRAVFSALQWKCYCSRTLKHVRPSGAQQGLWSQTLFSSPMLRLPSLTFLGISEEFCSQFLIKSLQGNFGSCLCLQTGLSVTSIQQHILQIFQYLPKWIVIYLRVVKKTRVLCWFDNVMLITWCVCRKFAGHHRGNRGDGRLPALHEDSPRVQLHCEGNTHTQVTCWVTLC